MGNIVRYNTNFILSHFGKQHELFPRAIMTARTKDLDGNMAWKIIENQPRARDIIFAYFSLSKFEDCRINAFPYNTQHSFDWIVKNKTAATFIMIDLDLKDFGSSMENLDKQLDKTTKKLYRVFRGNSNPTILWTGNGYHIYQPIDGFVFETYETFYEFLPYLDGKDLTTEFLRFAEKYFTDGKSDLNHLPSINSCLIRVPGTFNTKNGHEISIIQKWDGKYPDIKWITKEFHLYLIQKRINKINEKKRRYKRRKLFDSTYTTKDGIKWVENLLKTPLVDYRKYCLWRILCPYLINVKKLSDEQTYIILTDWLQRCNEIRKLDFNTNEYIKNDLKNVGNFFPPSKEKMKEEKAALYETLISK